MSSKWRKAKLALGCIQVPRTLEDPSSTADEVSVSARRFSDANFSSPADSDPHPHLPLTPIPSSSGLRLPRHSSKSSKKNCAICLNAMAPGNGHAIFTAECSHSFHFNCITSNVRHGNRICPVCRAKWKEVPLQRNNSDLLPRKSRANSPGGGWSRDDPLVTAIRHLPLPRSNHQRNISTVHYPSEPALFDDDDELLRQNLDEETERLISSSHDSPNLNCLEVNTYPEFSAISKTIGCDALTVLVHLKAPTAPCEHGENAHGSQNFRVPVDLITVLDVSGSMAGTKLALLKRAMGFVIQHLGPHDRLSVVAFSSSARRLFPLQRMTDAGRNHALQAVNALKPNGGTNIGEGLKKGAKVILERKWKNPVSSIILLSDGQDTYSVSSNHNGSRGRIDYKSLLPSSTHIPVHTFGFGVDHDAIAMHSISENSGGTFSFIEAESVIQDAFAQCIGGLLSVVVQELRVCVGCVHQGLKISSVKAGSYQSFIVPGSQVGYVVVGDLYAEEERDFLVTMSVPPVPDSPIDQMPLLKVSYSYKDPVTEKFVSLDEADVVVVNRPMVVGSGQLAVSIEVDRQKNRLEAAEAMSEAKSCAERGDLSGAVSVLERCRRALGESASARNGDRLCVALGAELKEMQERMANRQVYESSGRAYVLSGLCSHSWQRATARGDSTDSTTLVHAYQTSSMVDMVSRSQTMVFGSPSSQNPPPRRPFTEQVKPR